MKTIKGFFTGPQGEGSSKRLAALACIIAAVVRAFVGPSDPAVVAELLGAGTLLLGVSALTKT
jgi:hypothetical protein